MPWFKVDDSFYDHPKVFDAPDCAVALWVRAGTWSARNLTNGFVPSGMPARLCDDPYTAVKELVRRGLWSRASGGFQFHDWTGYQPTKESVQNLRDKRAQAGRKGGQAKAAKQNASNVLASARPFAWQNAAPARPGPTPGGGSPEGETPAARARDHPPPRRCPKHTDDPDPPNCGACRDARIAHDAWQRDQAATKAAASRDGWSCHRCAVRNRPSADVCRQCGTAKGAP